MLSIRRISAFFYTERGLYFGIINHQPADTVVRRLTIRDASPFDIVLMLNRCWIDASGEGRYGYGMRLGLGDSRLMVQFFQSVK